MPSASSYYNRMVIRETPYMSTWMTDTNHLRQFLDQVEPQKMDNLINGIFMQRGNFQTPFLSDLEKSAKSTMLLTGPSDSWTWKFKKKHSPPVVVENLLAAETNVGRNREPFPLLLDRDWYTYGDVISPDRFSGIQVRVIPEGIQPEGKYWKYWVQIVGDASLSYNQKYMQAGTEYEYLYSIYGEFNDQGTKVIHAGDIQLMNSLAGEQRTEDAITDWADALTITVNSVTFDDRGKPVTLNDSRWFKRSEMAVWAKHRLQKENYLFWAAPSMNLMSSSPYETSTHMGYWHMLHMGNVMNYPVMTMKRLESAIGEMYYNRVPMNQRDVVLYTGEAGFILFSEAVAKDLNGLGGLIPLDKFISGSGMNMEFGYQFIAYRMKNGGRITLKHLPLLDMHTTKHERGTGRFSRLSATFIGMDMSKDSTENVKIVKRATRPDDYWSYIPGTTSPYGPLKGGISSTKKAGYEMQVNSRVGLHVEDVTKCFLMKPTFSL